MKYTKQENDALAVFGIIIVLSVIEIILAAALAKVSDSSHKVAQQPTIPMYTMYYQQPVGQVSGLPGQTSANIGSGVLPITAQDIPPPYRQMSPH
ncbi:unnamed protein product [Porites lobata]|uniref:Uncharacterized protein n=1 Tax=Porites lobata TaxID=104759 RepID=A0ABN8RPG1_9CNID|nr:unnamed protein product [Porites lobata]